MSGEWWVGLGEGGGEQTEPVGEDPLENGNIRFSVNFPAARLPRLDAWRITLANANVPNIVGQMSTSIAHAGLNIEDLLNKSIGEFAYTIVDVNNEPSLELLEQIGSIEGVLALQIGRAHV